jgi:hypothetical protein
MSHSIRIQIVRFAGAALILALPAGCPQPQDAGNGPSGSNSTLDTAFDVALDSDGKADLTASRISGNDVTFYKIGDVFAGDRVVIDVRATSGNLDAVAAIFDANEDIFAFNDDRTADGSNLNPLLDVVIRADGAYFLGVTPFPGAGTSGAYRVVVSVERGVGMVAPSGQVVYFNWAGGDGITVNNVGTFNLTPFDAADVGLPASQTDALKQRVEEIVADRYKGLNITFASSDRDKEPAVAHSTIEFGGFNRSAFAISEQIDTLNADHSDDSIIFTRSFNGAFSRLPSFEQMAIAIGNTTAHEIGHLLGLIHTKQCTDLMDTTCGNDSLVVPQEFERAPLDNSVFPTGFQDSPELLGWTLGLVNG